MNNLIELLEEDFEQNANPKNAEEMKRYMKDISDYYGIKSELRRKISKRILNKTGLPEKDHYSILLRHLWEKDQREFQYFAQEFAEKYIRLADWNDLLLYEYMITTKSWWDTVDYIAAKLVGPTIKKYPDRIKDKTQEWINSGNIWLQRTAILFQLKYKNETDEVLLFDIINQLKSIHTFFIEKAIGWALREYGKSQPKIVLDFVNRTTLPNLSRREALKRIV